jgi:hypothetical protein
MLGHSILLNLAGVYRGLHGNLRLHQDAVDNAQPFIIRIGCESEAKPGDRRLDA